MTTRDRRVAAPVVVLALTFLLVLVGGAPALAGSDADTIGARANAARAAQGLAPLTRNANLDAVALAWAHRMADARRMSHNPDVADQIPSGWRRVGENVAMGYPSGAAMHGGWMDSSGHRANILGDYTDIGIAFIRAGGSTWGVQVFANYPGSGSRPAPAAPTTPSATPTPKPSAAPAKPKAARTSPRPTTAPTQAPKPPRTTPTPSVTPSPSTAPTPTTAETSAPVAGALAEPGGPSDRARPVASDPLDGVGRTTSAAVVAGVGAVSLAALALGLRRRTADSGRHRG
ncbi:CAP domain-containing protein [Mumia sp. zg.B21]|uniref:CAP domain-containing protein n=1 Tax=Mumia sp. zg.B21 TaxID=2855447 RepID=UPI001C6E80DE|nr:CAP domain-containing protein [Mumia sp. zg.B21]MBW9209864.1 CAP domain-containing protein [Mumia sp. zg.B21]